MFDYDAWKTGGYGDGEREISVSFECGKCEVENETEVVVGGRSGDVDVECAECGENNSVSFGDE
jgi:hypothetical protein